MEKFEDRESEYVAWVHANQDGFVVNVDKAGKREEYPMVHRASHKLMRELENYTTGDYMKFCSKDIGELEAMSRGTYGRPLSRCGICMRTKKS